ncbi:BMP family lipoprotein [Pyrococcus yayanosii]|uniref:Basic membrane lipoprotein n=1 Tax=Pyrococcus yayanosii (strain CH1 / JCM 16557) TaxID=529709 RepID=F8AF63_PYRYC|nr:BMP family protein [Pyrococcus yayanosii]AEH24891.1 basic membrane lipoprotein [Pyrococcus yayanosii CH1]
MRNRSGLALAVAILVMMAVASGCIQGETSPTATPEKKVKVAVLFDVGGRGDLSFNDMAYLGAERAKKELGVEVDYMTPKSNEDMVPLLRQLSESGEYDLLVLIGFLWTGPLNEVADDYPNQKFALIDSTTGKVRENEVDILFREQEVAALMGVIASGMAYELGGNTIGAVAGMDIPPLWKFHIGYLFGAKYFEKKTGKPVKVLWQYTGTFTDTQVGYNTAMQLLQQDAKVLYGLAGLTHVGMFNAIIDWNEQGKGKALAMGQDASQEWYAPKYIPISGAKRVDVAVYKAIEMVVKGEWKGGIVTLGLKENGVGYWDLEGVREFAQFAYEAGKLKGMTPDEVVNIVKETREAYIKPYVWDIVNELAEKIKSGEIVFKTPKTHEEYEKIIEELNKGNLDAALEKGSVS